MRLTKTPKLSVSVSDYFQYVYLFSDSSCTANALASEETRNVVATHLTLSALSELLATSAEGQTPTKEQLKASIQNKYPDLGELPDEFQTAIGEVYVSFSVLSCILSY